MTFSLEADDIHALQGNDGAVKSTMFLLMVAVTAAAGAAVALVAWADGWASTVTRFAGAPGLATLVLPFAVTVATAGFRHPAAGDPLVVVHAGRIVLTV